MPNEQYYAPPAFRHDGPEAGFQRSANRTADFKQQIYRAVEGDLQSVEENSAMMSTEGKGRDQLLLKCRDAIEQLHAEIEE